VQQDWAKNPEKYRERANVYNHAHPERARAHSAVARAVKSGKLVAPDRCSHCEAEGVVWAHHDDYDRPLDVRWLCPRCHNRLHSERWDVT